MPQKIGTERKKRPGMPCACGKHVFAPATKWGIVIVSACDSWVLDHYCWTMVTYKKGPSIAYAESRRFGRVYGRKSPMRLHRVILGEKIIDHKDGNGLNNQRDNLRLSTQRENMQNRRGTLSYKGISRVGNRWVARITKNSLWLGSFETPQMAAKAYDAAAKQLYGDFARLNFPEAL